MPMHSKTKKLSIVATSAALMIPLASPVAAQEANPSSEVSVSQKGIYDEVSRVYESEKQCKKQLAYYVLTFKGVGVCIPGPGGTSLLSIRWRS